MKTFPAPHHLVAAEAAKLCDTIVAGTGEFDDVAIDFAGTDRLDLDGINVLVFLHKHLKSNGYRLLIGNVRGQPLTLLTRAGVLWPEGTAASAEALRTLLRARRRERLVAEAQIAAERQGSADARVIAFNRTRGAA